MRIIPAHAGKSDGRRDTPPGTQDHPRSCGEKPAIFATPKYRLGSSPLMRGKARPPPFHPSPAGIIPAHAGKSKSVQRRRCAAKDHPRSCGEKYRRAHSEVDHQGSSPLMRGKASYPVMPKAPKRIIPAHAGKSFPENSKRLIFRDHPRSCGEKHFLPVVLVPVVGSSPLMRGKVRDVRYPVQDWRIIPAHAGKSDSSLIIALYVGDHPRSCGEMSSNLSNYRIEQGSSPLMRGKVPSPHRDSAPGRIIPAHAGKSFRRC